MILLYFLLLTSCIINASEDKIVKYEQQLVRTCVEFNNALDGFLSCKTPDDRVVYFNTVLSPEISNFEDLFLQAPAISCNPLGKDIIAKAFKKIVKPLQSIDTRVSELPIKALQQISFNRDLFFETMYIVYEKNNTFLSTHYPNTALKYTNKKPELDTLIWNTQKLNTQDVHSLQCAIQKVSVELNTFLKTLENVLAGEPIINDIMKYFVNLIPKDVNDEYEEEHKKITPDPRIIKAVDTIKQSLDLLEKNLKNFNDYFNTELSNGILNQTKDLHKKINGIFIEYEKNYIISQRNIEILQESIELTEELRLLCTSNNIKALQTETMKINCDYNDKKTTSLLKLITRIRLCTPNTKSYPQALQESIERSVYTKARNAYNAILQVAGKQVANLLVNQQNQPSNNTQNTQPVSSLIDMVRNPQAVVQKLATQAQHTANTAIENSGQSYIQHAKKKKEINKIHNALQNPETYFKACSYAWAIHINNIKAIPPLHKQPVNNINPYTKLYALKIKAKQGKQLLITSSTEYLSLKSSDEKNDVDIPIPVITQDNTENKSELPLEGQNIANQQPPIISNSWYTWITENKDNIQTYLNKLITFQQNFDKQNKELLEGRDIFFTENLLITQMPNDCVFKPLFSSDPHCSILEIAFITLPNACSQYLEIRNNTPVDCETLWNDKDFLKIWQEKIAELKNNYSQKINELKSSLKSYDKFRLWIEKIKKTELFQPLYGIIKEVTLFFINFTKAILNINTNNKIDLYKEQQESAWRTYAKCVKIYNETLHAMETLEKAIEDGLAKNNSPVHQ